MYLKLMWWHHLHNNLCPNSEITVAVSQLPPGFLACRLNRPYLLRMLRSNDYITFECWFIHSWSYPLKSCKCSYHRATSNYFSYAKTHSTHRPIYNHVNHIYVTDKIYRPMFVHPMQVLAAQKDEMLRESTTCYTSTQCLGYFTSPA